MPDIHSGLADVPKIAPSPGGIPVPPPNDLPCRLATSSCRGHRRIGDRAFCVAAPRAWNRLPTQLKLLRSTNTFRCRQKTFLFQPAYTGKQTDDCFVMRRRSASSGRNANDLWDYRIRFLQTGRSFCRSTTDHRCYKKLSYRRGTTRCVVSIEILPIATQQCRNYLYDKS